MDTVPRRRLRFPRHQRYPIWNPATITVTGAIVAAVAASAILLVGEQPLVLRLEWTLAVLAACLFVFLFVGLYRGARLRRERFAMPAIPSGVAEFGKDPGGGDFSGVLDIGSLADGDELGCLAPILGIIVVVLVFLFAALVLPWLLPLAYGTVALVAVMTWWLCYLALRRVFALARRCRGDAARSLGYALLYTVAYTGVFFAVLFAWQYHTLGA